MSAPTVSVVIPLYRSSATLTACLEALASQTFRDFELILVDSSPTDEARAVAEQFPQARYFHVQRRLLPQAARNLGAGRARGLLLAFTDPDIRPEPSWLSELVAGFRRDPAIIFGPIACLGRRWIDVGAHFTKFSICLPGGIAKRVRLCWSGNVLIERSAFDSLGGWEESRSQGDSVLSARAEAAGYQMRFEPEAVVFHDHERILVREFVKERFRRGREFAEIEASGELCRPPRRRAGVLLLPLRLLSGGWRITRSAARSGMLVDLIWTSPVVAVGLVSWYAGLAAGMMTTTTVAPGAAGLQNSPGRQGL